MIFVMCTAALIAGLFTSSAKTVYHETVWFVITVVMLLIAAGVAYSAA